MDTPPWKTICCGADLFTMLEGMNLKYPRKSAWTSGLIPWTNWIQLLLALDCFTFIESVSVSPWVTALILELRFYLSCLSRWWNISSPRDKPRVQADGEQEFQSTEETRAGERNKGTVDDCMLRWNTARSQLKNNNQRGELRPRLEPCRRKRQEAGSEKMWGVQFNCRGWRLRYVPHFMVQAAFKMPLGYLTLSHSSHIPVLLPGDPALGWSRWRCSLEL